ncbi:beta-alanine-activating enzyme beta-propeller domain-containing protein [Salinigranum halophilum]|uniref:serine/threonine-protein kinase n=1 Tax=Salinigranum halophilum TaxID=2565931 RepID=UPI00115EF9A3|nr:serine/threonine-protein kinase [Salinigranum halophilum]
MTESPIPDRSTVASPPRRTLDYTTLRVGDRPIDTGGHAIVYEVSLNGPDPPDRIALKEPHCRETLTREVVERFLAEASTWELVDRRQRSEPRWQDSEHVVGVIDTGDDLPWVAMEFMDGGDLDSRLRDNPDGLPVDEALWIGESICRGVEVAHSYGIAHLDLKPANVLFRSTPTGVWDVPKVADWGLSRVLAEQTGTMEGLSVEYAAPEQFDADGYGAPDTLTDVYQLGALVYALLTGEPPYTGSQVSIMHDVLSGAAPATPSNVRDDVPAALDAAVATALNTAKSNRYRTATTFGDALEAIRTDRALPPVVARQLDDAHDTGRSLGGHAEPDSRPDHGRQSTEAQPTGAQPTQWPMFRGGPARTGSTGQSRGPRERVAERWTLETGGAISSSPTVVEGTVYVGSGDGHLYAVDTATGAEQWCVKTEDAVTSSPTVVDGTVYVGSKDSQLYAVDTTTGEVQWRMVTGDPMKSSPAVVDGTAYVGSDDSHLYAVDTETGFVQWVFEREFRIDSSPAVVDGTVYVGCRDYWVYAVDASTGDKQWSSGSYRPVYSSPVVVDGTVYVGAKDGYVRALDADTGEEQWRFDTGDVVYSSPAVVDGRLYVGNNDGQVSALDADTGEERWTVEIGAARFLRSSPAVSRSTVYVCGGDQHVYAFEAATGEEQWRFETDSSVQWSSPAVGDGTVYVGSNDGVLYALVEATD